MNRLAEWTAAVCAEFAIDQGEVDRAAVLGLARTVARDVDRPSAHLAAFLLGIAVARGLGVDEAAARLSTVVTKWRGPDWRD